MPPPTNNQQSQQQTATRPKRTLTEEQKTQNEADRRKNNHHTATKPKHTITEEQLQRNTDRLMLKHYGTTSPDWGYQKPSPPSTDPTIRAIKAKLQLNLDEVSYNTECICRERGKLFRLLYKTETDNPTPPNTATTITADTELNANNQEVSDNDTDSTYSTRPTPFIKERSDVRRGDIIEVPIGIFTKVVGFTAKRHIYLTNIQKGLRTPRTELNDICIHHNQDAYKAAIITEPAPPHLPSGSCNSNTAPTEADIQQNITNLKHNAQRLQLERAKLYELLYGPNNNDTSSPDIKTTTETSTEPTTSNAITQPPTNNNTTNINSTSESNIRIGDMIDIPIGIFAIVVGFRDTRNHHLQQIAKGPVPPQTDLHGKCIVYRQDSATHPEPYTTAYFNNLKRVNPNYPE